MSALPEGFAIDAPPSLPEGFAIDEAAPNARVADAFSALPKAAPKSGVMDFLSSLPRGLLSGLSTAASAGGQAANIEMGQDPKDIPDAEATTGILENNVTGVLPKPEGLPGRVGASIGEVLGNPGSYVGPGGLMTKLATGAGAGAGSELAGEATKGGPFELAARLIGGIAGGSVPRVAGRIVTPLAADAEHAAAVNTLRGEGVTSLSAGQVKDNDFLRNIEDMLGNTPLAGNRPGAINRAQADEFTGAALRRVGENAPRATPEVVDGAFRRIGNDFDELSARNRMEGTARLGNDLQTADRAYMELVPESQRAPIVENVIRDIGDAVAGNGGSLPGNAYQALRSRLSSAARGSQDPHLSHALSEITESLDDEMARSIARNNPADSGGFEQARRQYRNMLVVERAATTAGENSAKGVITPAALASATKSVQGRRAFARGQGDFEPLARAGQAALLPLPNSGTAQKMNAMHHLQLGGLLGGADYAAGDTNALIVGALGGLLGPAAAGRTLMSRPTQAYLSNSLAPRIPGLLQAAPLQAPIATAGGQ